MSNLPVREMVLYKHGVGFFVREGRVEGESVALNFRQDEINDILKSLAVFDRAGGQVLGLHYQTPMDQIARLASSSINLADHSSIIDLLRDLRGRAVTLEFETTPGTVEAVSGRIVGLNEPVNRELEVTTVSVLTGEGQVRIFQFDALRGLHVEDSQSQHDLGYFLDTSMSENNRRMVTVRLSEGQHDLAVYYVAPSPTWRVSYRLVAETHSGAETDDEGGAGKALLQVWGLFDNRLDEDLQDVQVTLVAGQPISFIYELYASRIPQRPTVQDETRIAPGPVEYEAAPMDASGLAFEEDGATDDTAAEFARQRASSPSVAYRLREAGDMVPARRLTPAAMTQSTVALAQTADVGEFFEYRVTAPVSVKRGESALVPIISCEVAYERELLFNDNKLADHPVVALRFKNTTGLTLERGPVTVVENGVYKGEALVSFSKRDNDVYLAFAVELGVQVRARSHLRYQSADLALAHDHTVRNEYQIWEYTYAIHNTTSEAVTVIIERHIQERATLFESEPPDVETQNARRWRVHVPAHETIDFEVKEHLDLGERWVKIHRIRRLMSAIARFLGWIKQHLQALLGGSSD